MQVVCEQVARRRPRYRFPGPPRLGGRSVRHRIEERTHHGDCRGSVGDCVVHLDEQPDPLLRQPGEEAHLPQRQRPVQAVVPQLLDREQELGLVAGVRKRRYPDVVPDVEHRGVHPQRAAQSPPREIEDLPEPGT